MNSLSPELKRETRQLKQSRCRPYQNVRTAPTKEFLVIWVLKSGWSNLVSFFRQVEPCIMDALLELLVADWLWTVIVNPEDHSMHIKYYITIERIPTKAIPAEHPTKTEDSCASPTQAEAPAGLAKLGKGFLKDIFFRKARTNLNFSTGSLVFSIAFFAFSTIIDSFRSPAVFGRDIVDSDEFLNSEQMPKSLTSREY